MPRDKRAGAWRYVSSWLQNDSAYPIPEVLTILDYYALVYEELLAVPVIKGQKTGKFAKK